MLKSALRMKPWEKVLLLVAIIATVFVFYYINFVFTGQQLILWAVVEAGIMWVIIISLLLLADNHRMLNEELKDILREHVEESRTLKQIAREQLEEIKLLKNTLSKR